MRKQNRDVSNSSLFCSTFQVWDTFVFSPLFFLKTLEGHQGWCCWPHFADVGTECGQEAGHKAQGSLEKQARTSCEPKGHPLDRHYRARQGCPGVLEDVGGEAGLVCTVEVLHGDPTRAVLDCTPQGCRSTTRGCPSALRLPQLPKRVLPARTQAAEERGC